jgi:hypothetical protein
MRIYNLEEPLGGGRLSLAPLVQKDRDVTGI